ncbi:MAG: hypothetical protein NTX05_09165 [Fusobacteria bacterium]|nr:hypothetical protein [Fusobacteriota bacterium]
MATSGKRPSNGAKKAPQRRTSKKKVTKTKFHPIKLIILIIFVVAIIIMGMKVKDKITFIKNQRASATQKIDSTIKTQTQEDYQNQVPSAYQKSQEINDDINSIIESGSSNVSTSGVKNSSSTNSGEN